MLCTWSTKVRLAIFFSSLASNYKKKFDFSGGKDKNGVDGTGTFGGNSERNVTKVS
jgi:hypothetical protein